MPHPRQRRHFDIGKRYMSFSQVRVSNQFINLTRSDMYVKVRMVVSGVSSTGICNIAKTSQTLSNIKYIKVND